VSTKILPTKKKIFMGGKLHKRANNINYKKTGNSALRAELESTVFTR
jgi:hypothetical protein